MDQTDTLKVLLVAAEATPFAKVGGLAEFSGALSKALRGLGVDARVIIPRYGDRERPAGAVLRKLGAGITVPVGSDAEPAHLFASGHNGAPIYLVYNAQHFGNRERVYGFNDDPQRYMFFSRAVLAALPALDWVPDVVHTVDWHTAPVSVWLRVYGARNGLYRDIATLHTIHDLAYQGLCGRLLLSYGQMMEVPHLSVEPPGKIGWVVVEVPRTAPAAPPRYASTTLWAACATCR